MKGDFSRIAFDPSKRYTRVLRQQGRVDLDSDHNAESAILEHLQRNRDIDVIGASGGPLHGAGFDIVPLGPGANDLLITQGSFYVDGLLCEAATSSVGVAEAVADDRWELETLDIDGKRLLSDEWVEILVPGEETFVAQVTEVDEEDPIVTFDADLSDLNHEEARVRRALTYMGQPHLTEPDELEPEAGAKHLLYLDVWQRHVTAIQDPDIREVALGGPDTTTRVQTVWQVRVRTDVDADANCIDLPDWPPPPSGGRLTIGTTPSEETDDPCLIAPGSVYRGVENHLYRVEIHRGGSAGTAAFKWSRDNGSVVFGIEDFPPLEPNKIKLRRLGRDRVLTIKKGDWIEVLDDATEFGPGAGFLVKVDDVDEAARTLRLREDLPDDVFSLDRHPRVRRWDQKKGATADGVVRTKTTAIELEHGVEVRFAGTDLRPGDYWVFAARTATGEVERLVDAPPHGTKHHYAKLALVEWIATDDGWVPEVEDCRALFPPATELTSFYYLGGDGQECMPGAELPQPLQVGVSNGTHPVDGAEVEFRIVTEGADGDLFGEDESGQEIVVVETEDGIATCRWKLGAPESGEPTHPTQQVEARLLDADENTVHLPITFSANLSVASEVAYFPEDGCIVLEEAETVQAALDELCGQNDFSYLGGDGQEALPGEVLAQPLRVGVTHGEHPIDGATVKFEIDEPDDATGGELQSSDGNGRAIEVTTDNGVAQCEWKLDTEGLVQVVEATLLDEDEDSIHLPIRFTANQSVAETVAYTPAEDCGLDVENVQDALDELCRREHGGGCATTVGVGGEFPGLREAIKELLKRGHADICLCLLPGTHKVESGLQISSKDGARSIKISGCGAAGTRIVIEDEPIHFEDLAAVWLSSVRIASRDVSGPLVFERVEDVRIEHCTIDGMAQDTALVTIGLAANVSLESNYIAAATPQSFDMPSEVFAHNDLMVALFNSADSVAFDDNLSTTVEELVAMDEPDRMSFASDLESEVEDRRSTITDTEHGLFLSVADALARDMAPESEFRHFHEIRREAVKRVHGLAVTFRDAGSDVVLEGNEIAGHVSFHGEPAQFSDIGISNEELATVLWDGRIYSPSGKSLRVTNNQMTELRVGERLLEQFRAAADQVLSDADIVDSIDAFENAIVHGNTFEGTENEIFAQRSNLSSNVFDHGIEVVRSAVRLVFVGNVIGNSASFVGNQGGPMTILLTTTAVFDSAANPTLGIRDVLST